MRCRRLSAEDLPRCRHAADRCDGGRSEGESADAYEPHGRWPTPNAPSFPTHSPGILEPSVERLSGTVKRAFPYLAGCLTRWTAYAHAVPPRSARAAPHRPARVSVRAPNRANPYLRGDGVSADNSATAVSRGETAVRSSWGWSTPGALGDRSVGAGEVASVVQQRVDVLLADEAHDLHPSCGWPGASDPGPRRAGRPCVRLAPPSPC